MVWCCVFRAKIERYVAQKTKQRWSLNHQYIIIIFWRIFIQCRLQYCLRHISKSETLLHRAYWYKQSHLQTSGRLINRQQWTLLSKRWYREQKLLWIQRVISALSKGKLPFFVNWSAASSVLIKQCRWQFNQGYELLGCMIFYITYACFRVSFVVSGTRLRAKIWQIILPGN